MVFVAYRPFMSLFRWLEKSKIKKIKPLFNEIGGTDTRLFILPPTSKCSSI